MRSRLFVVTALTTGALALVTCLSTSTPALADPAPAGDDSLHTVVAVLRDQLTASPATPRSVGTRAARATAAQNSVLDRLVGRRPSSVQHFALANAVAATVTGDQLVALRQDPAVASVGENVTIAAPITDDATGTVTQKSGAETTTSYKVPASACTGTRSKPQLEPEGLQVIGARSDDRSVKTAAALGYDGAGVKVAFIADALDPSIADFRRADGSSAIVENTSFDPAGTDVPGGGQEAFGDAGTIIGQGRVAHDLADWVNPAAVQLPNGHCWIRVEGVAPGASLVALDALDDLIHTMAAIDHAVTVSHVDVLNESFGIYRYPEASARNAIAAANAAAIAAGVTVVASTGDAGVNSTIATPAANSADGVIAVGATTHLRAQVQTGGYGLSLTGATRWMNDQIDAISSSGTTSDGRTVDLVAPGYGGWAPCSTDLFRFPECTGGNRGAKNGGVQFFAGTSQAAPFTAGTAALVIQAYRATHGGQTPSPTVVKQILTATATDLGAPSDQQGAGRLDARAAVEAATTWTGTTGAPAQVDRAVLAPTSSQVTASGTPGSSVTVSVPVQNTSGRPVTVTPTLRSMQVVSSSTAQATLDPATMTLAGMYGQPMAATRTTVDVPSGADRVRVALSGAPTPAGAGTGGLTLALYDPTGTLATVGLAQDAGTTYSEVSVDRPVAGRWTVVIAEYVGSAVTTVLVRSDFYAWTTVRTASIDPVSSPLSAGGRGTIHVEIPVPASGSTVYTLDPGTAAGTAAVATNTIPVIVQGVLAPTSTVPSTFSASLLGGNGRGGAPSQTLSYVVQVPTGASTLVADLRAPACGCEITGLLIDPAGRVRSTGVNEQNGTSVKTVHQTVAAPDSGTWHYVVQEAAVTTRATVAATLRGTLAVTSPPASAPLPTSASTTLVAGQTVTVPVTVENTGNTPMTVLIDAQRNALSNRALPEISGQAASFTLPFQQFGDGASQHLYLVPPGTTSITASTSASTPVQTSLEDQSQGTYVVGSPSTGATPSATTVSRPAQGIWTTSIAQVGPFSTLAPSGTGTTGLTGTAPAVDRAVSSPTGPNFDVGDGVPVTIAPGRSAVIPVTITPPASWAGRTVAGRLVVSTAGAEAVQTGSYYGVDVVALLPYRYTVAAAAPGR